MEKDFTKLQWVVILIIGESFINKAFTSDYEQLKSMDEKIKRFIEVFEARKDAISLFTIMGINFLEGNNQVYYRKGEISILKNYSNNDVITNDSENVLYAETSFKRFFSNIIIGEEQRVLIVNYGHGSIFGQFAVSIKGFSRISKLLVLKNETEYKEYIKAIKLIKESGGSAASPDVIASTDVRDKLIDNQFTSFLLYSEYANVLKETIAKDRKVDIMLNYICLTQNCAAIYEFIDTVNYMVGPTTGIDEPGYNYSALLNDIISNSKDVKQISSAIVENFKDDRVQNEIALIDTKFWSLSVLDLSNFKATTIKIRTLVEILLQQDNCIQLCSNGLNNNLSLAQSSLGLDVIFCVKRFIENVFLSNSTFNGHLQIAKEVIEEIDSATVAQFHSSNFLTKLNSQYTQSGLGIFMPEKRIKYDKFRQTIMDANELEQKFHSDEISLWKKLLKRYLMIQ